MSRGSRGRWLFLVLAALAMVVAAVLASLSPVVRTLAQPVGGAAYTGEITGCDEPPCGTVEFSVSGDGSEVQGFTAYDVPGDVCEFQGPNPFPVPLDIVDDSFGPGIPDMYEVSGSFPSEGEAQGTLRLVLDDPPYLCDSGTLDWTASTSGTPTPTPTPPPGCEPGIDHDGDGFDGDVECYVGTDPLDSCPDVVGTPGLCPGPSCDGHDAWPPDLDVDTDVDIADVLKFKPYILTSVPPSPQRFDLDADGDIDIVDIMKYKSIILTSCTNL